MKNNILAFHIARCRRSVTGKIVQNKSRVISNKTHDPMLKCFNEYMTGTAIFAQQASKRHPLVPSIPDEGASVENRDARRVPKDEEIHQRRNDCAVQRIT